MSIPIDCPKCGTMIGEVKGLDIRNDLCTKDFPYNDATVCNHPKSKKVEKVGLFGLIKEVLVEYPETETCSAWAEYCGPSNKFMLWVAIVFSGYRGVTVNKKWVWWNLEIGFYGLGIDELENLHSKAA